MPIRDVDLIDGYDINLKKSFKLSAPEKIDLIEEVKVFENDVSAVEQYAKELEVLTRLMVRQAIDALNTVSQTLARLKAEMLELSSQLPEYPVVMGMCCVGESLGPQLMAEIGNVTKFAHRSAITSFAGVDPSANQSGTHEAKSARISKSGSPELRRALFLVMESLIETKPQDDPVYLFMDKKRAEGKPYLVYMTAGANKFLEGVFGGFGGSSCA